MKRIRFSKIDLFKEGSRKYFGGGGDDEEQKVTGTGGGQSIYIDPNVEKVNKARAEWITKYLPQFVPGEKYSGKFTAPMTGQENKAMGLLDKYLGEDVTKGLTGAATNLISGLLTNKFNPSTSDYYKAFRTEADYNNQRAIDATRRDTGSRNKFFSDEGIRAEGDINAQTSNFLQKTLATLAESERQRQIQSVPLAQDLALEPVRRAQYGLQLGQTPRLVENLDLEKQYQDFVRQRNEMALPVGAPIESSAQFYTNPYTTYSYGSGSSGADPLMGAALGGIAKTGTTWALNAMMPGMGSGLSALGGWLLGGK